MAFSAVDTVRIFDRMGTPRRFLSLDTALLQAVNAIGDDAEASALVVSLLDECDRVDRLLKGAQGNQGLKQVKGTKVVFRGPAQVVILRSEGRRYAGRIAKILGVKPRGDSFSGTTEVDVPAWTPLQAMYGNNGGGMKMG